tara:strand:- start:9198 stop:10046 length:849 start_codon:yes stop_codon:yes gene_type:complete
MSLQISKFNPKQIEERRVNGAGPATCVFIGKRGTGKSTLVADILYHCRKIPLGVAISATEDGNAFYSSYIPDIFIHSEYKTDIIQQIVSRQKKAISTTPGKKNLNNDAFVLLDDCMYDKKMIRDPNIRGIFMNGRHWRITFMLTMQYCMDLPPDLRTNIDFVFILRENIIQNQDKLYKNFFGIFPHVDTFREVMNSCTEGYDCMVLDNTSRSNKITDCVYWYRAKPDRKFKIGSKDIWNYHKKHYNEKHSLEDEQVIPVKSTASKLKIKKIKTINNVKKNAD